MYVNRPRAMMIMNTQQEFKTLISAAELQNHRGHNDWLVIDVRHDLTQPGAGYEAYAAGHIPGAVFLHLDADLSGPKTGHNGRHPLPDCTAFATRMAALGMNSSTQVIAYDAHGGMYAARIWWMLRWTGHARVAVLDGGWPAWLAIGGDSSQTTPLPRLPVALAIGESLVTQKNATDVLANLEHHTHLVMDARAPDRFRGENETFDPVGGHIPGARNRFFRDNLQSDARFKPAEQLRREFLAVQGSYAAKDVIMQCGSGVTACHNLLAMEIAGLPDASLYPGSWSEWCADPVRPFETGAQSV